MLIYVSSIVTFFFFFFPSFLSCLSNFIGLSKINVCYVAQFYHSFYIGDASSIGWCSPENSKKGIKAQSTQKEGKKDGKRFANLTYRKAVELLQKKDTFERLQS